MLPLCKTTYCNYHEHNYNNKTLILKSFLTLAHYFVSRCEFYAAITTNVHRNDITDINLACPVYFRKLY